MATYDTLSVYKASYDLLLAIFKLSKEFDREYKYTLGESVKKEAVSLVTNIYRANSSMRDRVVHVGAARENIETIRLFLRLLRDLRQINLKKFATVNMLAEFVSKQCTAWQKSSVQYNSQSRSRYGGAGEPNESNHPLVQVEREVKR